MSLNLSQTLLTRGLACVGLALLGACASTPMGGDSKAALSPVETRQIVLPSAADAAAAASARSAATPQSSVATVNLPAGGANAAGAGTGNSALLATGQRVVYFDYDSFSIKDDFKSLIEAQAKTLGSDRAKRLVIEGHTDERGGREYNLALGQKRADAVLKSLALLGAAEGQLEAVSFGQERPATTGADESAWARNRRAEMKDR